MCDLIIWPENWQNILTKNEKLIALFVDLGSKQ